MVGTKRTMAKVARARKIFENIQNRTGMSEAGKDWLIAVLDPMHDEKLMVCGYPDREVAPSVVQVIKQSLAIAIPSAYTNTHTWGFHVLVDDTLFPTNNYTTSNGGVVADMENMYYADISGGVPNTMYKSGGLQVVFFDQTVNGTSNVTTVPRSPSGANNTSTSLSIDAQNFAVGKTRVLAVGFEVVNTTAELYKGGALAVYEQPSSIEEPTAYTICSIVLNPSFRDMLFVDVTDSECGDDDCERSSRDPSFLRYAMLTTEQKEKYANGPFWTCNGSRYTKFRKDSLYKSKDADLTTDLMYQGAASMIRDVLPPISLAEALILPGTQQWDAQKGCYCVQTMNDMKNPPSFCLPMGKIFTTNELLFPVPTGSIASPVPDTTHVYGTEILTSGFAGFANQVALIPENMYIPFNRKGAIVTGLTPQSTFTINYNVIVERIISSQDKSLATLAKPSPPEDYIAVQLYSEMAQRIPIGCAFDDNDFGEWILGMADQVANVVSSIGKPILQAVDSYQNSRSGATPKGATYGPPKVQPTKVVARKPKPLPPVPAQKKVPPKPPPKPKAQKGKPIKKAPPQARKKGS